MVVVGEDQLLVQAAPGNRNAVCADRTAGLNRWRTPGPWQRRSRSSSRIVTSSLVTLTFSYSYIRDGSPSPKTQGRSRAALENFQVPSYRV